MITMLATLPLAIVMVAGPQIISAIILATSGQPRKNSVAYVSGVALALVVGGAISFIIAHLAGKAQEASGGPGVLDWIIIGLLCVLIVTTFRGRGSADVPGWMTGLQKAEPKAAFNLGFVLILLFPGDIVTQLGVAQTIVSAGGDFWEAIPFYLMTLTLAALPLLMLLVLGDKAQTVLPPVRTWMNANSWLISIVVYIFFIIILLG